MLNKILNLVAWYILMLALLMLFLPAKAWTPKTKPNRVVKIVGELRGTASGYIYEGNKVITNKHVCLMDDILYIHSQYGVFIVKKKNNHEYKDICIIQLTKSTGLPKAEYNTDFKYWKVSYEGYPDAYKARYTGKIIGERILMRTSFWMAKLTVWGGASGSGVLNEKGELVGIISMLDTRDYSAYIIKMSEVKDYLEHLGLL